ncbi:MAG: HAD family phosphatase [Acidimicrobiia bacterium]
MLESVVFEELARASGKGLAVVFDCDGVLVDSEPASEEAWRRTLTGRGMAITAAEFHQWVGRTDRQVAEHYAGRTGVAADVLEEIAAAHLQNVLSAGLAPFADALHCLDAVAGAGLGVAVASNSPRRRLDAVLAAAGLEGRFTVSVAGDEVSRPKPAPDVYLAAAEAMTVRPRSCLALEDSPVGIQAAAAAGMWVVAVDRGIFHPAALVGANRVVAGER